jgi:hypothetical protein
MQGYYVVPDATIDGSAGAWVRQEPSNIVKYRWFGADPTGVNYSDEAISGARDLFDKHFYSGDAYITGIIDPENGIYKVKYSVNYSGIGIYETGVTNYTGYSGAIIKPVRIKSTTTDPITVDFTATARTVVEQLVVDNNNPDGPTRSAYGVVFSRYVEPGGPGSSDNNRIDYLRVSGHYTCSAYANFGAEVMTVTKLNAVNKLWYNGSLSYAVMLANNPTLLSSACAGGVPSSKYRPINLDFGLAGTTMLHVSATKNVTYSCNITAISKANPAVVTVSNAASCFDNANTKYNLVNNGKVFLTELYGDDTNNVLTTSWRPVMSRPYTARNVNTTNKTFELYDENNVNPVNTTGLSGNYVANSGQVTAYMGPTFYVNGNIKDLYIGNLYSETKSAEHFLFDMTTALASDANISGFIVNNARFEFESYVAYRFIAASTAAKNIRDIRLSIDQASIHGALIDVQATNGITFHNPTFTLGDDIRQFAPFATSSSNYKLSGDLGLRFEKGSLMRPTLSGSCTMSAGTCTAQSFGITLDTAPVCTVTWKGAGTLSGNLKVTSTTTSVTPSSSGASDTAQVNWSCK